MVPRAVVTAWVSTVGQGEAGRDGVEVLAYGVGEDTDGVWATQPGLLNPVSE
jgi:hypothetical protein